MKDEAIRSQKHHPVDDITLRLLVHPILLTQNGEKSSEKKIANQSNRGKLWLASVLSPHRVSETIF